MRKQYPEALVEFQAEVGNNPNHAQALVYLGDCYLQVNKSDDARSPLQKGLALDPSLGIADLDLGIIDSQAGRNDDALRELNKARALMPGDVNVRWRLARLLRAMGRTDEANAEFEAAKKLNQAADEDLYKKIANGKLKNPDDTQTAQPPAAPAQ
jgi:tetratricopeptide (TPR) repeat protein